MSEVAVAHTKQRFAKHKANISEGAVFQWGNRKLPQGRDYLVRDNEKTQRERYMPGFLCAPKPELLNLLHSNLLTTTTGLFTSHLKEHMLSTDLANKGQLMSPSST